MPQTGKTIILQSKTQQDFDKQKINTLNEAEVWFPEFVEHFICILDLRGKEKEEAMAYEFGSDELQVLLYEYFERFLQYAEWASKPTNAKKLDILANAIQTQEGTYKIISTGQLEYKDPDGKVQKFIAEYKEKLKFEDGYNHNLIL